MELGAELRGIVKEVMNEFAADPRLAVFEVDVVVDETDAVLVGATSESAAVEALHLRIATLTTQLAVRDEVIRLPVEDDGFLAHGIVRSAMAPMLAGPLVSESPVSQVVMGQRLLVLQEYRRWLQCRTVDDYIGWVHRGYVERVDESAARMWEIGEPAPLHMSLGAEIFDETGEVVHRVPWGGRLGVRDERGFLPDGTSGRLVGAVVPVADLDKWFPPVGESVVRIAGGWLGAPYAWGGITPAGVDCSGLVQSIYRAHGYQLPRDSDLQAKMGQAIDPGEDFGDMLPGDLLFFAEDDKRITHIAISEGGSRIIHSALGNGGVRRNDLTGKRGLEEELRSLFVCARRIIPRESRATVRSESAEVRRAG